MPGLIIVLVIKTGDSAEIQKNLPFICIGYGETGGWSVMQPNSRPVWKRWGMHVH